MVLLRDRWRSITLDWKKTVTRTLWAMRQDNGWIRALALVLASPSWPTNALQPTQGSADATWALNENPRWHINNSNTQTLREEHVCIWQKRTLDTSPGCFNYHQVHVTAKLAIFDAPVFRSPESRCRDRIRPRPDLSPFSYPGSCPSFSGDRPLHQ